MTKTRTKRNFEKDNQSKVNSVNNKAVIERCDGIMMVAHCYFRSDNVLELQEGFYTIEWHVWKKLHTSMSNDSFWKQIRHQNKKTSLSMNAIAQLSVSWFLPLGYFT